MVKNNGSKQKVAKKRASTWSGRGGFKKKHYITLQY